MSSRTPMTFKFEPAVVRCLKKLSKLPKYSSMTNVVSVLIVSEHERQFQTKRGCDETTNLRATSAGTDPAAQ